MTFKGTRRRTVALLGVLVALAGTACRRGAVEQTAATPAAERYPEPRFPSYLKPVTSVEDVLSHVRPLVRNKTGFQGAGLCIANAGDTVTFVTTPTADPLIVEAVKRAMEERKVKVNVVPEYEMVGVS